MRLDASDPVGVDDDVDVGARRCALHVDEPAGVHDQTPFGNSERVREIERDVFCLAALDIEEPQLIVAQGPRRRPVARVEVAGASVRATLKLAPSWPRGDGTANA